MNNIEPMHSNGAEIILDDIQIAQLEALANYLPMKQVAGYFNISVDDFRVLQKKDNRVLRAFKKGKIRGVVKVVKRLWQQIEAGNITAIIFFLKTRGGWSEQPFKEDRDSLYESKPLEVKFKNIKTQAAPVATPKAEPLYLVNTDRNYTGIVAPISLKVVEMRKTA